MSEGSFSKLNYYDLNKITYIVRSSIYLTLYYYSLKVQLFQICSSQILLNAPHSLTKVVSTYPTKFYNHSQGDLNTALNDLTNIIRHNQDQSRVYLARAEIYQKQGDVTGAILNYSQVIWEMRTLVSDMVYHFNYLCGKFKN